MMPSSVLLTTASSDNSTIAASCAGRVLVCVFAASMSRATSDTAMTSARRIAHRGNRQRNAETLAFLGHARGLEVVNAIAAPDLLQDLLFLVVKLGRDQQHDRLAHRTGMAMAENSRRGLRSRK